MTKLNLRLLIALGLSRDSAEIVMERITELEAEIAKLKKENEQLLNDQFPTNP